MRDNESNILYFADYVDDSIDDTKYDEDVELELISLDDIDYYLTSNESYSKKISTLKNEREKLLTIKEYLDTALYSFENNDTYLDHMQNINDDLNKELKYEVPVSIVSAFASIVGLYGFFANVSNIEQVNSLLYGSIFAVIAALGISICAYYGSKAIKDGIDYKGYKKELKRYKKFLEEKTTK